MADGSVSLKWCTIIRKRRRCDPACAEDRPTDFGTVKGCEMAGLGTEIAFTDRPLVADEMFCDVGAQIPVAPINIGVRSPQVSQHRDIDGRKHTATHGARRGDWIVGRDEHAGLAAGFGVCRFVG